MMSTIKLGVPTACGCPQCPRVASAPGAAALQARAGVAKSDAAAGVGAVVAGSSGVYPAAAVFEPNCHR